jgi:hypothetical protein
MWITDPNDPLFVVWVDVDDDDDKPTTDWMWN